MSDPLISEIVSAAEALVEAVTFDDSGAHGRGGNGGLLSRETIRKARLKGKPQDHGPLFGDHIGDANEMVGVGPETGAFGGLAT